MGALGRYSVGWGSPAWPITAGAPGPLDKIGRIVSDQEHPRRIRQDPGAIGEGLPRYRGPGCGPVRSTQTRHFARAFPERFFNMGIAEQDLMGTAAGLGLGGKIPFASTFAMFATGRAWEQIRQTIAYGNLNVKIVASHGGVTVGEDGGSHGGGRPGPDAHPPQHGGAGPGGRPRNPGHDQVAAAYQGPVYMRTGRMPLPVIHDGSYRFELGRGAVLRQGDDLTLVGLGIMVHACLKAAQLLAEEGIAARVVNLSCLKPLDWELLVACARETGAVVTAEEHMVTGALERRERSPGRTLPSPAGAHRPAGHLRDLGSPERLLKHYGLSAAAVAAAAPPGAGPEMSRSPLDKWRGPAPVACANILTYNSLDMSQNRPGSKSGCTRHLDPGR